MKTKGLTSLIRVVEDDVSPLKDIDGNDAMLVPVPEMKDQVQRIATATLLRLYQKAFDIVENSPNEKNVLEAMKFIKTLADGDVRGKHISAMSRASDAEILSHLVNAATPQDD